MLMSPTSFASVIGLLFGRGPSTILGEIAQIVVDSIQRQTFRGMPHIRKEILKFEPFSTDCDPSPSITLKVFDIGISTTAEHRSPNTVDFGAKHSMSSKSGFIGFSNSASTRLSSAEFKGHRIMTLCAPTFANASPSGMASMGPRNVFQCSEVTENITWLYFHSPSLLQLNCA